MVLLHPFLKFEVSVLIMIACTRIQYIIQNFYYMSDLESLSSLSISVSLSLHCMCVCAPFRHFLTKRTHICHLHPFTLRNLSDLWAEIVQLWNWITPPWQARDFITATTRLIAPDLFPRRKHGNLALGFNEWPQTVFELSFVQCVTYSERYVRVCILIKKSDCSALMLCSLTVN